MLNILSIEEVKDNFDKEFDEINEYIDKISREIEGDKYNPDETFDEFMNRIEREIEEDKKKFDNFFENDTEEDLIK